MSCVSNTAVISLTGPMTWFGHGVVNRVAYLRQEYPDGAHPTPDLHGPVNHGYRIHRLHLCKKVRPSLPTSLLDMTLRNLMVRLL